MKVSGEANETVTSAQKFDISEATATFQKTAHSSSGTVFQENTLYQPTYPEKVHHHLCQELQLEEKNYIWIMCKQK